LTQKDLFESMEDPSSSQGDSPVRGSVRQMPTEKEQTIQRVVTSGRKCTELLPILNLSGSLAKMCQGLLLFQWHSKERLLTWKHQAIRQSVSIFQLVPQTLSNTLDNDFGLSLTFPTPAASDTEGGIVKNVELKNGSFSRVNKEGVRWGVKLRDAVNYLEMYPTPAARDYKGTNSYERTKEKLEQGKQAHVGQLPNYIMMKEGEKSEGALNPDWVESYLMDYPIGWTRVSSEFQESQPKSKTEQHDLKQSETQSFPQSQKSSQEQS